MRKPDEQPAIGYFYAPARVMKWWNMLIAVCRPRSFRNTRRNSLTYTTKLFDLDNGNDCIFLGRCELKEQDAIIYRYFEMLLICGQRTSSAGYHVQVAQDFLAIRKHIENTIPRFKLRLHKCEDDLMRSVGCRNTIAKDPIR